ncbi:MAG: hypothetical protein WCB36_09705 [Burkholderiales bacterium]
MQNIDLIRFFVIRLAIVAAVGVISLPHANAISDIALSADNLQGAGFSLKQLRMNIRPSADGAMSIRAQQVQIGERIFKTFAFDCTKIQVARNIIDCPSANLVAGSESAAGTFRADVANQQVDFRLAPNTTERVIGRVNFNGAEWNSSVEISAVDIKRLAPFLPATAPQLTNGSVGGTLVIGASESTLRIEPDLVFSNLFFSDKDGLRAGEKINTAVKGAATRTANGWRWSADVDYRSGEALWTPLYFEKGGHKISASGSLDDKAFRVDSATLQMTDIGAASISLGWDRTTEKLADFRIDGKGIQLDSLYRVLLKPFLEKTPFNVLNVKGAGDIAWLQANGETRVFDLSLRNAQFDDANNRFAVSALQLEIPWKSDEKRQARIRFASAKVLNVPLGTVDTSVDMHGYDFSLPRLILPILDGKLEIKDFKASQVNGEWMWKFAGGLSPTSLADLTKSMKLPELRGNISGEIPVIEYAKHDIKMNGALVMQLLDGFAIIKDVALYRALSDAPQFTADVDARNLDLALMTDAFSFGKMQGRVDLRIVGMELVNWKPVRMDASIMSSPGNYAKKISQQAVQNISALGGAGAAAAIQRSFLGFFEQFGYEKLGLTCKLYDNICDMGGIESTPQGYVIVKGGGIPAITVLGYNRTVGWQELLDRLARITKENAAPVIK